MKQLHIVVSCPFLSFGGDSVKKRVLSLFLVICFVFTGVLGVCVSADVGLTIVGELIEKTIEYAFDSGDYGFLFGVPSAGAERFQDLSDEDRQNIMSAYRAKMREADEYEPIIDDTGWSSNLKPIQFYCEMAARAYGAPALEAGNFHYMIWAVTMQNYYQINVRVIYDTAHTNDFNYFLNYYNEPCVERFNYRPVSCVYATIVDNTMFDGDLCRVDNGMYDPSRQGCYTGQNMSASNVYCYATDMVDAPLRFASDFSAPSHKQYNITLNSNKPVPDDLIAVFGVLYNDGTHTYDGTDCGYINADYIGSVFLQGGNEWEWHFNQQEFSNWAYRKRIFDTDCFYAFVHVLDGDRIVYADSRKLNLYDPTGIFEDLQPMPDPDNYTPTSSPFPTLPDVSFDYTPTNNYNTYNYDTVNNYDSTTQNFNDWLGDIITTINNNIAGGLDNIGKNVKVTGDNLKNFTEEFKNYIEGSCADINEYLGDLIKKFNNDFLSWTDSFSRYLHDLFQSLNDNISVVGDNIVNAIQIQAIPDRENVIDLCKTNFPLYDDLSNAFSEHDVSNSELIVAIPYLSNDNANGIQISTRDLNSAAFSSDDVPEEISRDLNADSSSSLDGYYIINISSILRNDEYNFSRFRSVATIFILGSTFFTLFNITLKCFGMNYGALSGSDSKDDS